MCRDDGRAVGMDDAAFDCGTCDDASLADDCDVFGVGGRDESTVAPDPTTLPSDLREGVIGDVG